MKNVMRKKLLLYSFPLLIALPSATILAATTSKSKPDSTTTAAAEPSRSTIQDALKEFNSLSRKEKKSRFKEMKKAIKEFKEQKKAGSDVSTDTLLLVLLALFIPPLAVYLHEGETNNRFWISVLLTILGLLLFSFTPVLFLGTLPGIIYALIVILGD
jgi:uncharacterized membrane protein YqaE (UPF0057 family)